ncbi:MAG TPA: peptidoglycan bridge formation glycyltransferase FemA/FemB family protein [Anaerolineaceae bacterium]|nr:peptidoglycan bridge formation glycyltransferase FemA/FemB family protein [Anaerolineaceae bacterium]
MREIKVAASEDWDALISQVREAHLLQTWEWGLSKKRNGWAQEALVWDSPDGQIIAAAMLLLRQIKILPGIRVNVLYCPKGPTLKWEDENLVSTVLQDLETYTKKKKAIFLKIDPDVLLGTGIPGSENETQNPAGLAVEALLKARGWHFSQDQIQFRNSVFIDLNRDEETLLAAMKQKTRYNIRLAERRSVIVRQAQMDDLPMLYSMYAATGVRDGFVVRHEAYYTELWGQFMQAGMANGLIAEFGGKPIAAVMIFHFAGMARYMFGMSLEANRDLMPNYLLQWEAIKLAKCLGCLTYDFWGAPDDFNEQDSLWGVYRFKEGFNGVTVRHIGAWDFVARPYVYKAYTEFLPKLLDLTRRWGKAQNRKKAYSD